MPNTKETVSRISGRAAVISARVAEKEIPASPALSAGPAPSTVLTCLCQKEISSIADGEMSKSRNLTMSGVRTRNPSPASVRDNACSRGW